MALTRPRFGQLNTSVVAGTDPITVLHAGSTSANVDVGFLINRANGLVSNVALYWNESGNAFVTAFTSNTGLTDSNIAVTGYANIVTGTQTVYGSILPAANITYDLGSPTQRFRTLYISGNTIDIGGHTISTSSGQITFNTPQGGLVSGLFSTISANANTPSTSTTTGTMLITGGAGITGNVYIGGNLDVAGTTIFRNIETVTTTEYVANINATNLYASTIGNIGANLVGTGTYLTALTALNINGTVATANISYYNNISATTTNATYYPAIFSQASGNVVNNTAAGLTFNPSTNILNTGTVVASTLNAATIGNVSAAIIGATGRFDTSITTNTLNAATIGNTGSALTGATISTTGNATISGNLSVTGFGYFGGAFNESSTSGGVFVGNTGSGTPSPRIGLFNGTASQNWQIDNYVGTFRWFTPGVTRMQLDSAGNLAVYGNVTQTGVHYLNSNIAAPALQITGTATRGGAGYHDFLSVTNQGGGTNPNKNFRLDSAGTLQIINSAYSTNILNLTDAGDFTVPGNVTTNRLYTTTGLYWAGNNNIISTGGGGSATAGVTGQVQYNNGGALGATSMYYFTGNNAHITSANIVAGQVYSTNNGNGTNFAVGDDAWIGDINVANTMGVRGQQDATQGYIVFGNVNNTNYIGRSGSNPITVTGAFSITGNTAITSTIYGQGIYDNGNRVVSTSSGAGNLSISGTAITLPSTGPGATTVGSSTSIPVITTDAYGRVTALTSSAVSTTISLAAGSGSGSVAGGGTLTVSGGTGITTSVTGSTYTITNSGVTSAVAGTGITVSGATGAVTISIGQSVATSASPTFAGGTFNGNIIATTLNAGTIGNASAVLYGTLNSSSASQTNITALGNLSSLAVSGTTSTRGGKTLVTNFTGNTAPGNPQQGDEWWYAAGNTLYKYIYDGTGYSWVNITPSLFNASTSATANTLALRDTNGNLTATNFIGVASSAKYADLAEIYVPDRHYEVATVVVFGGTKEITVTDQSHDTRVAGVISTNPAYLMNSECRGLPVAFTGRVPCCVQGPISKGQLLVTSTTPGVAQALNNQQFVPGCVIGKSLETITTNEIATIEVVVGRF